MLNGQQPSPLRGTLFFTSCLLLLLVGGSIPRLLKLPGMALLQIAFFLGLALLFAYSFEDQPVRDILRLRPLSLNGAVKSLFLGVLAWALAQSLGFLIIHLTYKLGGKPPQVYQQLLDAPFMIALLVGALLPSICEEIAFRGYLQWSLWPLGPRAAIWTTGILFGLMHLSLIRIGPLIVLGLLFAMVVQRSGSILPGMIMHFVNNATALSLAFFFRSRNPELAELNQPAVPFGDGLVTFLLLSAAGLGLAAWSLAKSFSTADLTLSAQQSPGMQFGAEAQTDKSAPAQGPKGTLFLLPLIPVLLIFLWVVAMELEQTFN